MPSTYLLFSMFSVCLMLSRAENKDLMSRIPEMLQALCPGANVCYDNDTYEVPKNVIESGFIPCCTDCSCHTDCHKAGNCCFPLKQYPAQKQDTNTLKMTEESCISLALSPQDSETLTFREYNMVTSIREVGSVRRKPEEQCGDRKVAPWGSFYPVFSKSKNRLYKNIECANLDAVSDAKYFDICLTCEGDDPMMAEANDFIENVLIFSNYNSTHCQAEFRYPGNSKDLKGHLCDPVKFCPTLFTLRVPEHISFTKDEIVAACESGLWSPFTKIKTYANVFCYICNGQYFSKTLRCTKQDFGNIDHKYQFGYAVLVNTDFIFKSDRNNVKKEISIQQACMPNNNEICRPVYCPLGESYHLGKCNFPGKVWLNRIPMITLNLTTKLPSMKQIFTLLEIF